MNQTILKSKLYFSCISTMFVIVLSADFIPKTYQFVVEILSVSRIIAIRYFKCFMMFCLYVVLLYERSCRTRSIPCETEDFFIYIIKIHRPYGHPLSVKGGSFFKFRILQLLYWFLRWVPQMFSCLWIYGQIMPYILIGFALLDLCFPSLFFHFL